MPQMAPLSWLLLFTMFTITLIMFNMMNYYSFMMYPPQSQKQNAPLTKSMIWKW